MSDPTPAATASPTVPSATPKPVSAAVSSVPSRGALSSDQGKTTIAESVVAKVVAIAAGQVPGVHNLGTSRAQTIGGLRGRIPGQAASPTQGVTVEVGETQAAIDLDVVVDYGYPIARLADSIRREVIRAVEDLVGLEVTEVNVAVDDVYVPSEPDDDSEDARVQ